MESRELRIGNMVFHSGIVTNIRFLSDENVKGEFFETIFPKPIPLTEDFFTRCGSKIREEGFLGIKINRDTWLEINFNSKICIIFCNDSFVKIKIPKYVHDLQNLYFALTGEELTTL